MNLMDASKYVDLIGEVVLTRNCFDYFVEYLYLNKLGDKTFALVRILGKGEVSSNRESEDQIHDSVKGYEVWILRAVDEKAKIHNKWYVKFPCNEDFGRYGWSYQNKESALKKIEELCG